MADLRQFGAGARPLRRGPLLAYANDQFLFAEREEHALGLAREVHDDPILVFQPQFALASGREPGLAAGLRIAAVELAQVREFRPLPLR